MWGKQEVITADVVQFEAAKLAFDRVVSVEMFEHMKNCQARHLDSFAAPADDAALLKMYSFVRRGMCCHEHYILRQGMTEVQD